MGWADESSDLRARREAAVRAHWEAENGHDPAGIAASFSDYRASYLIPAFGPEGEHPDHTAVQKLWENMLTAFPDFHIEPGPMLHGDDHIFVEVTCSGTQRGEFAGIAPTGRSFTLRHVANLFEFAGDQIVCERVYLDVAEMTRQLTELE